MFNSILAACVGSACRSPTAERLLQHYHPELKMESTGSGALVGEGAGPAAISVVAKRQLSLESHCVRRISRRLCRNYDLILTMGNRHVECLCEMAPEICDRVMLSGRWDNGCEIPDPCHKSQEAFAAVYTLLEQSTCQWTQALNAEQVQRWQRK